MFKVTRLVHLADANADVDPISERIRTALSSSDRLLVAATLPGSRNGGDILVHAQFTDPKAWAGSQEILESVLADVSVSHVDGVDYQPDASPPPASRPGSVYRTLLLAVDPATPADVVSEFEADLVLMPEYINTITTFQLSRPQRAIGTSRWTHVFEQQFTDEQGIMGAYLMHPIHWARVDRWFDPECPEYIVRERVCHSFCSSEIPILG